jgi:hypothetical protein
MTDEKKPERASLARALGEKKGGIPKGTSTPRFSPVRPPHSERVSLARSLAESAEEREKKGR